MTISFRRDGSVHLVDDVDPNRTLTIPPGVIDRDAQITAFVGAPKAPDGPSLSDWRCGLVLWLRLDEVAARVQMVAASEDAAQGRIGKVANERLEYANFVWRSQLLQLREVFGFTEAEVEESLWRAHRVSVGDLSGLWPLP